MANDSPSSPRPRSAESTAASTSGNRSRRTITRRRVNGRFLLILLGVLVALGAGTHFMHRAMVAGNAETLRERAVAAEEAGKTPKAIQLYSQYRKLQPDDIEATIALAGLLQRESDSLGTWRRVYDLLERALRQDPRRDDVRRTLVEAALELRQYADADVHLDHLIAEAENVDPELFVLKAEVQEGLQHFPEAAAFYVKAIRTDASAVDPYAELARVLRDNPDAIRPLMSKSNGGTPVDEVSLPELFPRIEPGARSEDVGPAIVGAMVAQGKPSWRARLERAEYFQTVEQISQAVADARRALESPEARRSSEAVLTAAQIEIAAAEGRIAEDPAAAAEHRRSAEKIAETGIEAGLAEPRLYLVLAELKVIVPGDQKNVAGAVALLEKGVAQAAELRESAPAEDAQGLLESEIELRWYLANYRLEVAGPDPARGEPLVAQTEKTIDTLRELGCRRELMDFLEVRLQLLNGEWKTAAKTLETLRLRVMDMPGVRRRVDGMLAVAYGRLENPDAQVEVFRRAVVEDPLWTAARIGLAGALVEAGRTEEALKNYATLLNVPGVPERMAQLVTVRELRKAESSRDLDEIRDVLEKADGASEDNPAFVLLNVELLIAEGKFSEAEQKLAQLAQKHPDSPEIWQARVSFAALRGDQQRTDRLANTRKMVAAGRERFGDGVEVRVARAELARLENDGRFTETLESLAEASESFSQTEHERLLNGLALVARRAGESDAERMMWRRIARLQPDSLSAQLRLAEFAVDARDSEAVAEALERIRAIEGPSGPNGNFIAAYDKIMKSRADSELRSHPGQLASALAEPRETLRRAAEQRPYWANIPRALGILESLLGNDEAAIEQFEQAWQLGDRTPLVATALVNHYQANDKIPQAERIIADVQENRAAAGNRELDQLAWRLQLEQGNIDGAVEIARRRAETTREAGDEIVYANLLHVKYRALSEEKRDAEPGRNLLEDVRETFAGVARSHPQTPEAWLSYLAFLQSNGETEAAQDVFKQAETALAEASNLVRLLGLARCHAVLGETDAATKLFQQAVRDDPDNVQTRMVAADYMSRVGRLEEAQAQVDWILEAGNEAPQSAVQWARRRGAFILAASRGRHEDVLRAIEMLRGEARNGAASVDDLRAQVALLAGHGSSSDRRLMLDIFEQIRQQAELTPKEKFQMASLYESTDQWSRAESLLEELLSAEARNPQYLAAVIQGTVEHASAEAETAERLKPRLEALETIEPNSLRTARTRAEFEKQFTSAEKAGAVLTQFVAEFDKGASREGTTISEAERADIAGAAEVAQRLDAQQAALELHRRLAEASSRPEDDIPLITYLARRARYGEALDLLEQTRSDLSPEAIAVTAVNIVSLGEPDMKQVARAEGFVDAALNESPESLRIQTALAGLRAVQGRYDDAEAIYRAILDEQPGNVAVLNNLAWLLMVAEKDTAEAARLIDEAIAVAGPVSQLVDTRGTIALARGKAEEAMEALQSAFAVNPDATIGFHLAVALERMGRTDEARSLFQRVRGMGLDLNQLHPSEHEMFRNLAEEFQET